MNAFIIGWIIQHFADMLFTWLVAKVGKYAWSVLFPLVFDTKPLPPVFALDRRSPERDHADDLDLCPHLLD
jgi:hypothetical protein